MTHSFVCDTSHSYVWDMTHPYMCDMMCVTWLIHMCVRLQCEFVTHSYVAHYYGNHDWPLCFDGKWMSHDTHVNTVHHSVTNSRTHLWIPSIIHCVTWLIHWTVFICVAWLHELTYEYRPSFSHELTKSTMNTVHHSLCGVTHSLDSIHMCGVTSRTHIWIPSIIQSQTHELKYEYRPSFTVWRDSFTGQYSYVWRDFTNPHMNTVHHSVTNSPMNTVHHSLCGMTHSLDSIHVWHDFTNSHMNTVHHSVTNSRTHIWIPSITHCVAWPIHWTVFICVAWLIIVMGYIWMSHELTLKSRVNNRIHTCGVTHSFAVKTKGSVMISIVMGYIWKSHELTLKSRVYNRIHMCSVTHPQYCFDGRYLYV